MMDPVIAEMHKIKEANGKRYATMEALARGLVKRERENLAQGRVVISKPLRPRAELRAPASRKRVGA
jgi:hypothetical protein